MKKTYAILVLCILMKAGAFGQKALYFPQTPATWSLLNVGNVNVTGDSITVEALITVQDTTNWSADIVSHHYNSGDCNYLLRQRTFEFTTTSGYKSLPSGFSFKVDSTYHVAATYDGDSLRYYVNGCQVQSDAWSGTLVASLNPTTIGNIDTNGLSDEQYKGYIDEVRIWNVARTQTQIASNMFNLASPTTQTGLLAYYKFEGNYLNIQGNAAYNGTTLGPDVFDTTNALFSGGLSGHSCAVIAGIVDMDMSPVISIRPNPASSIARVSVSDELQNAELRIYNVTGQIVMTHVLKGTDDELNISGLTPGIYTIETEKGLYRGRSKFIKE